MHQHRQIAVSFGSDPERYVRARSGYPEATGEQWIVGVSSGPDVEGVGRGAGVAARQAQVADSSYPKREVSR